MTSKCCLETLLQKKVKRARLQPFPATQRGLSQVTKSLPATHAARGFWTTKS